jgi:hypothetical protein
VERKSVLEAAISRLWRGGDTCYHREERRLCCFSACMKRPVHCSGCSLISLDNCYLCILHCRQKKKGSEEARGRKKI